MPREPLFESLPRSMHHWMHRTGQALPLLLILLAPAPTTAADRELEGSVYSGIRAFNEELGFNGEVSALSVSRLREVWPPPDVTPALRTAQRKWE